MSIEHVEPGAGAVAISGRATGEAGMGIKGVGEGGPGVVGVSNTWIAVYGESDGGVVGVLGEGKATGDGVKGQASGEGRAAVCGFHLGGPGVTWAFGVYGNGLNGVFGESLNPRAGSAIYGLQTGWYPGSTASAWAGYFHCNVNVAGRLWATAGVRAFQIDHPVNPANQFLNHETVDSPERKNLYDGVVELDGKGEAKVRLPEWFEALNENFRYQLTCLGKSAPVYVAEEVTGNSFKIAGGGAGMRVSWQGTGTRKAPLAKAHPRVVEEDKGEARGYYLMPQAYGADADKNLARRRKPAARPEPTHLQRKTGPART